MTLHPASHNTRIPIKEAIDSFGTMCPVNTFGNPGIVMSHSCVDVTFVPSGRFMISGFIANLIFSTLDPSMTNMPVAPVSAMACVGAMVIAFMASIFGSTCSSSATAMVCVEGMDTLLLEVVFDVTTVTSSSSSSDTTLINWMGFREIDNACLI